MDRGRAQYEGGVPKVPGYDIRMPPRIDANFKKAQTLVFKNGYAVPADLGPASNGDGAAGAEAGTPAAQLAPWSIQAAPAPGIGTNGQSVLPKWVEHDKQCLRFMAYFVEAVPDSPAETWRTRRVAILYYMEDDTMQVDEPREPNSGILQGTMIKRHRVPKDGGGYFAPVDFVVGGSVRVYGRELFIVDADAFTREFSARTGMQQQPAQPWPVNPIDKYKAAKAQPSGLSRADPDSPSKFAEALLGKETGSKRLQQFLEHSHEVLRFYAVWDDRSALYGDRRLFKVHFFVADNTVEVVELLEPNAGKDPFNFLKRGPLPKTPTGPELGGRPDPAAFYAPHDLRIGGFLSVHGRHMYLFDMDDATRKWYMDRMGCSAEELAAVDVSVQRTALPVPAMPPWNGYGTPEDSLQNCIKLVPSPPKRDLYKLMNKDRIVLRFSCRLLENERYCLVNTDRDRQFVLSFFASDDSIAVFEPPQRNSGIVGGKFLERAKAFKPGAGMKYYEESDFYVGATIELHGRRFLLEAADDFTLDRLRAFGPAH